MKPNNFTTKTGQERGAGVSRRDLLKSLMAGFAGATLIPLAAKGAPVTGLRDVQPASPLWSVAAPSPQNFQTASLPAYLNGNIVLSMTDLSNFYGALIWLDVHNQQFSQPVEFPNWLYTPVLANGVLYAGANEGGLYALDPNSGAQIWANPAPYNLAANLAFINGLLIFPTTDGHIVALTPAGTQAWTYSTGQTVGTDQASSPTFVNGAVIVAYNNNLFAVDADTGAFLWTYAASDIVLGNLTASSQGIHFSTRDQLVWCIQTNGTKSWTWPSPSSPLNATPSTPVVNADVIYVSDDSGGFNALSPIDGSVVWTTNIQVTGAADTLFVEDGVAYFSSGTLTAKKIFAIDLTSQGTRIVNLDLQGYGQLFGVENGVAYYSCSNQNNIAASDFAGQLHQFFCESELMVEDYTSSTSGNGYAPNTTSYRTHLQLLDPNYNPRASKSIKVWASDTATLTSGGNTYTIDDSGSNVAWLQTDGMGELSLVITATDLTCPAIFIWGNFMEAEEAIVIYPDHDALNTLAQTTGSSMTVATDYNGYPLVPDPGSAAALANTITSTMAGTPPSSGVMLRRSEAAIPPRRHRGSGRKPKPVLGGGANPYIAYPNGSPNMTYFANSTASTLRPYGTPTVPNFQVNFTTSGTTTTVTYQTGVSLENGPGALLGLNFKDLIKNVVHGVENVASIVYSAVEGAINIIVTTAENTYQVAVTAIEHAMSVVAAALKTAIGAINRAIQWLSYVFDWNAILETKEDIKTAITGSLSNWQSWLNTQASNFAGLHSGLQGLDVAGSLNSGQQNVSGSIQSRQVDNNNPQDLYGMSGAKSYTKSRYLMTKVKDNSGQGQITGASTGALGSSADTFQAAMETFFTTVQNQFQSNSAFQQLPSDVAAAFANLKTLFTDPSQFVTNSLTDIINIINAVAATLVTLADAVVEGLVAFLQAVIGLLIDLLGVTISIPVVSNLYQLISDSPLTALDLVALVVAIPAHIISAAISTGSSTGATVTDQKLWWFLFCGVQALMFAVFDVTASPAAGFVGRMLACVNIGVLGLGFPSDLATNTDFSYIFYSIKGIPPLLSLTNALGFTSAIGVTLKTITPYILCPQGIGTLTMAIVFAVLGKPAFIGHNYMQTVVNSLQSLPFICKPLATGPSGSPTRIALAAVDGVGFASALGVAIAQQIES